MAEKAVPISAAEVSIVGFAIRFSDTRFEIQRQLKQRRPRIPRISRIGSGRRARGLRAWLQRLAIAQFTRRGVRAFAAATSPKRSSPRSTSRYGESGIEEMGFARWNFTAEDANSRKSST